MILLVKASDASSILVFRYRAEVSVLRYVSFSFRTNLSSPKLDLKKYSDRTLIIFLTFRARTTLPPFLLRWSLHNATDYCSCLLDIVEELS